VIDKALEGRATSTRVCRSRPRLVTLRVPEEDGRWRAQLDELTRRVQRWIGNRAVETEIERLRDDAPPIVAELRADAITLAGLEVTVLLGAR
jgi:hypothetical protein